MFRFIPLLAHLFIGLSLPLSAQTASALPGPGVHATALLKTATTWDGAPVRYPEGARPEIQTLLVEIPEGGATEWHRHPVNNVAYVLEGSLRVELENGKARVFQKGDSFAEVVDTLHRGVNLGTGPAKLLVVYFGEQGKPVTVTPKR